MKVILITYEVPIRPQEKVILITLKIHTMPPVSKLKKYAISIFFRFCTICVSFLHYLRFVSPPNRKVIKITHKSSPFPASDYNHFAFNELLIKK